MAQPRGLEDIHGVWWPMGAQRSCRYNCVEDREIATKRSLVSRQFEIRDNPARRLRAAPRSGATRIGLGHRPPCRPKDALIGGACWVRLWWLARLPAAECCCGSCGSKLWPNVQGLLSGSCMISSAPWRVCGGQDRSRSKTRDETVFEPFPCGSSSRCFLYYLPISLFSSLLFFSVVFVA